jgi:transposase
LAAAAEQVVDVPAQLAARVRLLNSGHARKTDALDAASVAAVAVHHSRLRLVRAEGHSVGLRLLSDRRDDLAEERTRTVNRLHALLRDLIAGGAKRNLTAPQAAGLLRTVRPMTQLMNTASRWLGICSLTCAGSIKPWPPMPNRSRPPWPLAERA